ncbi:MAG: peptide ABC transporter permease, partial [Desulfopila sp.]|nr:peptide ABC transporter permease [Desulfopila sp.]
MAQSKSHQELMEKFTAFGDRSPGSRGNKEAADFIFQYFQELGLSPQRHSFALPVRKVVQATMEHNSSTTTLQPFLYNAVTPQGIDGSLEGPLYYVGGGSLSEFNGKPIQDALILMDFDSGINWQTAARLGAKALILVDRGTSRGKHFFEEKLELSPIQFPIFYMTEEEAAALFGKYKEQDERNSPVAESITLRATILWEEDLNDNIYTFIEGSDPELAKEVFILEAFYDTSSFLPGTAPGADEATSIITLLKTAETLTRSPPGRSVLLLATSGHSQTLAGFRDIIWAIQAGSKEIREHRKLLKNDISNAQANLKELSSLSFPLAPDKERDNRLASAIKNTLQAKVDEVSRQLVHLRLNQNEEENTAQIAELVDRRFALRQLSWKTRFDDLSPKEVDLFQDLLPDSMAEYEKVIRVREEHLHTLESTIALRETLSDYSIAAIASLHLSTHGTGVGGFHEGWLYQLKANINRTGIYSAIGDILRETAQKNSGGTPYVDSLQPSRMRTWDTWFLGSPFHGGEVSSLAGYLGFTLATVGDSRHLWGTPWDRQAEINWTNLINQQKLVSHFVSALSHADTLSTGKMPRNGFSTVTGRANLLLQGELFAEYPAQNTTIMAFQGKGRFYAMVDTSGNFTLKGVADRKNVVDKVIIEGYRFDRESGEVVWAIDKKETGKDNYRLKIRRANMKTDLTM